nr:MAG TPA: Rifin [Caudoviricetes sp.]
MQPYFFLYSNEGIIIIILSHYIIIYFLLRIKQKSVL